VLWFPLLQREIVSAKTVSQTAWDLLPLECPRLERLGPALQDIVVHLDMQSRTGAFECQVSLQYAYDIGPWSTPLAADLVLPPVSSVGYADPSAPFTDRTRLGRRRIRLALQYRSNNGVAGDQAQLSVAVACRPFCC